MSLGSPIFLVFLAATAGAAWFYFKSEKIKKAAWPLPENPSLDARIPLKTRLASLYSPILKIAALILITIGLSRPQKILRWIGGSGEGIDIMFAMDTSTSMSAADFTPSRIEAAKATALRFIQGRTFDRIGAVQFGGAPELVCPLTSDYSALSSQILSLYPGMTQTDGTAIGDGIVSAVNHLKPGTAKSKIIILMTDGRNNTGLIDPISAANVAATQGIKIYAIGCAKKGQALVPVKYPSGNTVMVPINDDLDDVLLTKIASITGGEYFRATNNHDLKEIYTTINALEKSKLSAPPKTMKSDIYSYPAAAAVILLVLEAILSASAFLRWP
ncbi:MAG: VWA domain-containing protein [Elusimicrobiota bacterium]